MPQRVRRHVAKLGLPPVPTTLRSSAVAEPVPTIAPGARIAERVVLAACFLVGVVARFIPGTPLWLDEALSVNIAGSPMGDIPDLLRHDGHPPLYYWLLHGWMDVFGDGDTAVRALSGVLGLAAIGLAYAVGRRHGGPTLGVLAAAVLAISPYGIRYSSEARMYELVVVFVFAGWLLLGSALASPGLAKLVALCLVTGALLLTHYWSIFLIAGVLAVLAFAAWQAGSGTALRRSARLSGIAIAAGGVFLVPWLSVMRYQSEHTGTPWAPPPRPTRVLSETMIDFAGGTFPESTILIGVLVVLAALAVFGRRGASGVIVGKPAGDWRTPVVAVIAVTAAFGAVVAFVTNSAFAGRYASVFFPLVVVLVAAGLMLVADGWPRVAALALVAGLGAVAVLGQVRYYDRTQAGVIADAIAAEAKPGDLVVVCPDQLGPALSRLIDVPGVRVVRYPDLGDPRFVDWVDYKERYAATDPKVVADRIIAEAGGGTIWLNWNDGYRVVGEQCGQLATALVSQRPAAAQIVSGDNVKYFEYSTLLRLQPSAPPG